jgi:hypothetical protein
MAYLESTIVVVTYQDDTWVFCLDNMRHMCEYNLEQILINEATRMIVLLALWSWQYQSVWLYSVLMF